MRTSGKSGLYPLQVKLLRMLLRLGDSRKVSKAYQDWIRGKLNQFHLDGSPIENGMLLEVLGTVPGKLNIVRVSDTSG